MLNALRKKTDYLSRTLKKIQDAEELEARKQESELKGHLLQTFAHQIPKGAAVVSLKNIFSDDQEEIEIKLNPAKTIHENARKYFEKFKNISEQKEQLSIKKDTFQDELTSWSALQERIACCSSLKELEKFQTQLIDKNILQSESDRKPDRQNLSYSFNRLLLGKKWEIFIGKNAKNNDLLTFQFARKFDLWFHAQGVPGSHVIIHLPDRGQHPPPQIIEQVASIAAYNSNAQHSSTVPVNYTEVRYVRKPRKAPPGTVVISNEKTIFVKPVKYF
jgi:predicted ribosome quality control (RQC) complex YloA/Tae2 family protein